MKWYKTVIFCSFSLLLFILLTVGAIADEIMQKGTTISGIDLSGMTVDELKQVISKAEAALKILEPLQDDSVLYEKDDFLAAIEDIELYNEKDRIEIHYLLLNDRNNECEITIDSVMINGWKVKNDDYDVRVEAKSNSKAAYTVVRNVHELSEISSFDDIESIELYGEIVDINMIDGKNLHRTKIHCYMIYSKESGIKVLQREDFLEY